MSYFDKQQPITTLDKVFGFLAIILIAAILGLTLIKINKDNLAHKKESFELCAKNPKCELKITAGE